MMIDYMLYVFVSYLLKIWLMTYQLTIDFYEKDQDLTIHMFCDYETSTFLLHKIVDWLNGQGFKLGWFLTCILNIFDDSRSDCVK